MSKKLKSAEVFGENVKSFRCPHCYGSVKVIDFRSLVCENNHTFDFAKQGYINLLTHSIKSQYDKELFDARQKIIMESNLYNPLHEVICESIKEHLDISRYPFMIADLGCGEGSHLQRILQQCGNSTITGVGLDISKEGILLAAKKYDNPLWIVGDLAKSPLMDKSYHVILNILSPSNYKEFKRISVPNGLIIKVVPRSNYLKELRNAFYEDKKEYRNDEIVSLFKKHFELLNIVSLSYEKNLNKEELNNLVRMTPLAWSADKGQMERFLSQDSAKITVDLDVLFGRNK